MSKPHEPRHPIRVVARRTGLTPATLRAWERRYGVVDPGRSEGGQRLYSDRDVDRLARLRALTDAGRSIGLIAALSDEELAALEAEDRVLRTEPSPAEVPVPGDAEALVEGALARVAEMDQTGLEAALRRAAVVAGAQRFLESVVAPFLERVGDAWAEGAFGPAHEHLASVAVQGVLSWLQEPVAGEAGGPRLVVATLPGERHGLGAMLAAAAAGLEGWQVTDLGVDLPVSEIARAARAVGARAVALSVVRSDLAETASRDAAELRRVLPGAVALIVGGRGSERLDALRLSPGVQVVDGLGAFRTALGRLG